MMVRTDAATTKDWLEARKGIAIAAYVQNYTPTATVIERPILPILDENLFDTLTKINVPYPSDRRRMAVQPELDLELQAWDFLSDEAFVNFERELD